MRVRGTVPANGLDLLAVFAAVRGEYGAGKTFFTRHLAERTRRRGFATAEVQFFGLQLPAPVHRAARPSRGTVDPSSWSAK